MDEKKPPMPQEIADEQLEDVSAGTEIREDCGRFFRYVGTKSEEDYNSRYLCPNCFGHMTRVVFGACYRCEGCGDTWFFESRLRINTESSVWEELVPRK